MHMYAYCITLHSNISKLSKTTMKLRSYTVPEFIVVRGSRPCSAATDSIHMIMLVDFILFLYILHGSLHIVKEHQMSHRTSWTDVIWVCYGLHGQFITTAVDFKKMMAHRSTPIAIKPTTSYFLLGVYVKDPDMDPEGSASLYIHCIHQLYFFLNLPLFFYLKYSNFLFLDICLEPDNSNLDVCKDHINSTQQ